MLIQAALTFVVLIRMYHTRIGEMRHRQIDPQSLDIRVKARQELTGSAASADNFTNLFETPVLFYAAILLALTLMLQDPVIVGLAWMYVILRIVHSFIHTTYNTVMHRFYVYLLSCIALLGMWTRLGWYIIVS